MIISEPMGIALLNERMLESYIYARKWWVSRADTNHQGPATAYCVLNTPPPVILLPQTTPGRLRPGGNMFPTTSKLYVAPFSDELVCQAGCTA